MNRPTSPFPGPDDADDGADDAAAALLRRHASYHAAPAGLREAILAQLPEPSVTAAQATSATPAAPGISEQAVQAAPPATPAQAAQAAAASPATSAQAAPATPASPAAPAQATPASPAPLAPRRHGWLDWWRAALGARLLAGAAGFAAGMLALWLALPLLAPQPAEPAQSDMLALLLDSHLRSLQVDHLTDVLSSDQHTVKPWFAGKLDYTPPVRDFAAEGFPLMGGRLEVLQGRQVAVLVYRHRLHTINLFIQPDDAAARAPHRLAARRGFQLVAWQADGMRFTLVSDLNADMLLQLAAKYAAG